MKNFKPLFCSVLLGIFLLYADICAVPANAKATTELDNPKEKKSRVKEEPDLLIPPPETPKDIKKKQKEEIKALKQSRKKTKSPKFKKSKKLKKRSYRSVKKEIKAPKTFDEYIQMSKDVKRADMKKSKPSFPKDEKLVNLPDPQLRVVKYNAVPGTRNIDLRQLLTKHEIVTQGVLSPDNRRLAYSVVYSYPPSEQVASEMFYINIPEGTSTLSALRDFHTVEAEKEPILRAGTNKLFEYEKRTFIVIDWSADGQKLAVKEKIGSQNQGPWKTQIWTYDFENNKAYELTAIREAIRYYWRTQHKLDLIDYMWDIYPLGWDMYNTDRIIAYAYAFGKNHQGAKFLGTWSIDYQNQRTELMSETSKDFEVSVNGYCLEIKPLP
ncbi:MAG: hypothetical protein K6C94_00645 [Candidatus Gastranaerophilales bacterium]|nr:hypothetical protein [Candidatus Gastranaerophilales bacterium]